jgi:hypothetical protein
MNSPICQTFRFTAKHNEPVSAMVTILNRLCCPAAVARLVVTVVVDPVYRMPGRWSWRHILDEGQKRILPPFAHPNSAATVVRKLASKRIQTTVLESGPNVKEGMAAVAVRSHYAAQTLLSSATAILRFAMQQIALVYESFIATTAAARNEQSAAFLALLKSDDRPRADNGSDWNCRRCNAADTMSLRHDDLHEGCSGLGSSALAAPGFRYFNTQRQAKKGKK